MLKDLLYEDRLLVDYADKELSIWPTEDWPYFSSYRERSLKLGETFEGLEGAPADLKPRMSFLAPLDPLMWDKSLIASLWDFQYSWEIYTPAVKRKYGYYTLPILYGEQFVGRIEAMPDRKQGSLVVKGLWWEQGIRQTKKLKEQLERTLRRFAEFNDCQF